MLKLYIVIEYIIGENQQSGQPLTVKFSLLTSIWQTVNCSNGENSKDIIIITTTHELAYKILYNNSQQPPNP